jgi:hypothetical protein
MEFREVRMDQTECHAEECGYLEPHDHGFACEPYCPCGLGVMAGTWRRFEAQVRQ